MPTSPGARLTRLRVDAGYRSAAEASRSMDGVNATTYAQHENGTRAVSRQAARTYAAFFRSDAGYILYGEEPETFLVPLAGHVRGKGLIKAVGTEIDQIEQIEAPAEIRRDAQAIMIETDDLWPAYRPGDVVYFAPLRPMDDLPALASVECVVQLEDGTRQLRMVTTQADGRHTLVAYSGPPQTGVRLHAVGEVLWVRKAPAPGF